ncbi:MAG: prolyl oligopeptidase family serine peptidase [Armatimonadota bacterium]
MKAALGLVFALITPLALAEEIPFLNGKATTVRGNARTPIRIDPIEASVLDGTLDTSKWEEVSTTADKPFTGRLFNSGYAYFEVNSDRERPMFLEARGHSMVYVNNEPRTGDVYSCGYVSLPVQLKKGKNTFLFSTARGSLAGKLVDAPKPISFNPGDQTTPDIIKGEKEKLWVAFIVRNATEADADDLTIDAGGTTTKVGRVMGMSVRKVGFEVKPNVNGKYTVNLKRAGKTVDTLPLTLRVRDKQTSHKRTFVSQIDGSIQYYAVQPSLKDAPGQALFLSLHGASVEGMGQAESYSQKSWGYVVSPTNRRPYGFDWEDIGRLDALEVLELAKKRYQTDPAQTYLTGHSMGGHGTYHLGVLYPDKFAAIAPCSGWASFFSYAGGATYPDTSVGNAFKRAMGASDTVAMKTNFLNRPIFIMHGEADDNVPVTEARNMRKELADHKMLFWHEEKGAGHWYDTDDEPGAGCQDYAPIYDVFAKTRIPKVNEVRDIDFKTPNLAISNQDFWFKILAQEEAGSLSSVKATIFPGLRKYVVTCSNVASFSLDLSPLNGTGKVNVEVNGKAVSVIDLGNGWAKVELVKGANENQSLLTGFKSVFNKHVTLVLPTGGSAAMQKWARNKARFDSEQLWYIGNGSVDIITHSEYLANIKLYSTRNLILYWDDRHIDTHLNGHFYRGGTNPIPTPSGELAFTTRVDNGRVVASIYGNEDSCAYADRIPLFRSGAGLPDFLYLKKTFLKDGLASVTQASFGGDPLH